MNVLIADDNSTNRKLLRVTLEAEGFGCVEAADGVEALAVLQREKVDALISDLLMPRMDGYRLCHEVRKTPRFSHLPFIVLTATFTSPSDEKLCLDLGADRFIRKPASGNAILEAFKEVLAAGPRSPAGANVPIDELTLVKEYSERLVSKLEDNNLELVAQTERLRAGEAQLRATYKEIGDLKTALDEHAIVAITDPQGKITYVNDKFCAISKYGREELLGQDHRIVNSDYHPKEFIRDLWATIASGKVWKGEIKNKAKGGSFYWVDTTIVPFLNAGGKPYQYVAIRADITERKRAEDEIRALNVDLEQRIRERTGQLEAAYKELESFSYCVSHDLRAPLRHIDGYVEMLTKHAGDTLSDKSRRYLKIVSESAGQMGQLIDDLLAFSRMERTEMLRTTVNLELLVRELIASVQSETTARNIVWKNGCLPMVEGDPSMLKQVFVNLLSNAVKYTRRKDPAEIEIGCISETANEAVMFVRDNGAGFDMKYVDKLFGVFQRLHRAEEFEGTGVGLANVRRIISRHGGRIWAESAINAGATFYFTLTKPRKG